MTEGSYTYKWPRPGLTVDTVIVAKPTQHHTAQMLLIKRLHPPYQNKWAIPGGFVNEYEHLHVAAARELEEETSVSASSVNLTEVGAFGGPGRDPRGWTVTVAYAAIVPTTDIGVKAADDAKDACWYDVNGLPELAFDHKHIAKQALAKLSQTSEAIEGGFSEVLKAAADNLHPPWIPDSE